MADLTASQLAVIAAEITNDPKGLGYPGKTVTQLTSLINTPGQSSEKVGAGVIQGWQLMDQIVQSEFIVLSVSNQNLFLAYASTQVDASNATVQANFLAMFPVTTAPTTRANLIAFVNRSATRAEILLGSGAAVSYWDVSRAAPGRAP